jgi:DNA polymerase
LVRYNIADVLLLSRLHEVVRDHAEPDVVAVDRVINERGVAFDTDLAKALIDLEANAAAESTAELEQTSGGLIRAADMHRINFLRGKLAERGVQLPDLRKETVDQALQNNKMDPVARLILTTRQAASRISTSKLQGALHRVNADSRLQDLLVYHKAHTGRWTGRHFQPQNLPRPAQAIKNVAALIDTVHDPEEFRRLLPAGVTMADAISALVRPCLRAAPGKVLCIADYASIEARGVAWCAREDRLLAKFAADEDVYCALASQVFGRTITKRDELERKVGKEAVLGCGYGMGADRFGADCERKGIDLAKAGTSAEFVVEGYRNACPAIAGMPSPGNGHIRRQGGLWKDVEAAAREAVATGHIAQAGRCTFSRESGSLKIRLPSGRRLTYRNARIEDVVPAYCEKLGLPRDTKPTLVFDGPEILGTTTYGGKLVENIVQAICRDLLAAALLECERQGLPVVLHVHDEIVVEVPADQAEESLQRLAKIMTTPPTWAVGFPVGVEAYASDRYLKSPPARMPKVKMHSL